MASRCWHCYHCKNTFCASRLINSICTCHACLCGCCKRCRQYARSYPILERAASVCTHMGPPPPPCARTSLRDVLALAKRMEFSPMNAAVDTGFFVALGLIRTSAQHWRSRGRTCLRCMARSLVHASLCAQGRGSLQLPISQVAAT